MEKLMISENVCKLIIKFCVKYKLPRLLETYLDKNLPKKPIDTDMIISMLKASGDDCHYYWAHWLILDRFRREQSFAALVANARVILKDQDIQDVGDLLLHGSPIMALTAIAHSPMSLTDTFFPNSQSHVI